MQVKRIGITGWLTDIEKPGFSRVYVRVKSTPVEIFCAFRRLQVRAFFLKGNHVQVVS
jgi:hypothetical protein